MNATKKLVLLAGFTAAMASPVRALEVAGISVPETKTVSGRELKLNGAGLRTATLLKVRIYVAALYAPKPLRTDEDVDASAGPLHFDFTFLRSFPKEKVVDAWKWQFEQSLSHPYPDAQKDVTAFLQAFGPIVKGGVESVEIEGNETRVYDAGVLTGRIAGRDFQKAFLSLWFGSKPVMPTLKAALLGKGMTK